MTTRHALYGLILSGAAALFAGPVLAGQVCAWKDASGVAHFGDRPPAQASAECKPAPGAPPPVRGAHLAPATRSMSSAEIIHARTVAVGGLSSGNPAAQANGRALGHAIDDYEIATRQLEAARQQQRDIAREFDDLHNELFYGHGRRR